MTRGAAMRRYGREQDKREAVAESIALQDTTEQDTTTETTEEA